jgi:glycine betaine/proline transport system permease protein
MWLEFPEQWVFGWEIMKFIDGIVDWVVINWDPFFSAVKTVILLGIMKPFEDFLLLIPWWLAILSTGAVAWRAVNWKMGLLAGVFIGLIAVFGMLDLAMSTLAIVITASILCIIFGVPLGIMGAKSQRFENFLRPNLDMMQTLPSFVYLIPVLMLFGLGKTPAVIATLIYAIPPIIRLTSLGIRQVDAQVVEAGQAFGATGWQTLRKIQIPLAMPTILAGLNQTIMMALAMVTIAAMIGAVTLGVPVLSGIARVEIGRGFVGGISIVFMAIILDRVSQGFAGPGKTKRESS